LHDCAIRVRACAVLIYRETIFRRCAELCCNGQAGVVVCR
jgi:hypothetical protein